MDCGERGVMMVTRKPAANAQQSDYQVTPENLSRPTTPAAGFGGSGMDGFIWQQLSDIQKSLGAIQEAQKNLALAHEKADDKVSGKLKKIEEELAEIKQIRHTAKWLLVIAGTVGGLLITGVGLVFKEVWSVAKPSVFEKLHTAPAQPVPQSLPTSPVKK